MPEIYGTVYGVEFQPPGRLYYYTAAEENLRPGDYVLAMNEFGLDVGKIRMGPVSVEMDHFDEELRPILRLVQEEDWETHKQNVADAEEAMETCKELIDKHELPMRLLYAKYLFDRSRLLFYFGADSRVDFRELVKDLARTFKTRIELRQIGIRDEVKVKGSLGLCGMVSCCNRFLREFESITLKQAKKQQLLINPAKISGRCGRLLCCLSYEQSLYENELREIPDEGAVVDFEGKTCKVSNVNLFNTVITFITDDDQIVKATFDEFRKSQKAVVEDAGPEQIILDDEELDLENDE